MARRERREDSRSAWNQWRKRRGNQHRRDADRTQAVDGDDDFVEVRVFVTEIDETHVYAIQAGRRGIPARIHRNDVGNLSEVEERATATEDTPVLLRAHVARRMGLLD